MFRVLPVVRENALGDKEYGFIPVGEILFMNMENNTPTFYTSGGVYRLANTFNSLRSCLAEEYSDGSFLITDRGVIVNTNKIKKFDEEKMILFLEKDRQYYATVSEVYKSKIIKAMEERGKRSDF